MARPERERKLCATIQGRVFKPSGIPARDLESVTLDACEAEALRLADLEGLYQEAAARRMGVSRPTFGRVLDEARRKVSDAILNGKALLVEAGDCNNETKGVTYMKIAIPIKEGGLVDEHFGHCAAFRLYSIEGTTAVATGDMPSKVGCGCKSGIASDLAAAGVTALVAGNMGDGAVRVLTSHGIAVIRGISGSADQAASDYAAGKLTDSRESCAGHGAEGHECGNH
jgi:predicted DNA-binding protein (UPF0251 family)/predicted Fe-Mo cluster-binding NifX family protein